MWLVFVSGILYCAFSTNWIVLIVNLALIGILLSLPLTFMNSNIEYLYLLSALLYLLSRHRRIRWLILLKLVVDMLILALVGVAIDYSWVFSSLVILDLLELVVVKLVDKSTDQEK